MKLAEAFVAKLRSAASRPARSPASVSLSRRPPMTRTHRLTAQEHPAWKSASGPGHRAPACRVHPRVASLSPPRMEWRSSVTAGSTARPVATSVFVDQPSRSRRASAKQGSAMPVDGLLDRSPERRPSLRSPASMRCGHPWAGRSPDRGPLRQNPLVAGAPFTQISRSPPKSGMVRASSTKRPASPSISRRRASRLANGSERSMPDSFEKRMAPLGNEADVRSVDQDDPDPLVGT